MYDDFLTCILLSCLLNRNLHLSNQLHPLIVSCRLFGSLQSSLKPLYWPTANICNRVGLQRLCLQPWAIRTTSRDLFDPFSDIIENQQMTFSCSSTQNFNWILIPSTMIKMAKTNPFFKYCPLWVSFFNLVKKFSLFADKRASNQLNIWLIRVIFGCLNYSEGLHLLAWSERPWYNGWSISLWC